MQDYEALMRRLEDLHRALADPSGGAAEELNAVQRRALRSRIEMCLLDLQRQLSELILLDSDEQFSGRSR